MVARHALITGGSSGIGLACAHQLAAHGVRLSLLARDTAKLTAAAAALAPGAPETVATFAADVADPVAVTNAVAAAAAVHGPIDLLITAAGIAEAGTFAATPRATFERLMAVNYFGTVHALQAVLPGMTQRGRGQVILFGSGTSLWGFYGYSAYGASKFALRGLAESLEAEYRATPIRISVVYPPDTDTPQLAHENRTKPPETRAITAGGGLWTADAVARLALRQAARGRFAITPGWPLRLLATWHSLLAPVLRWHFGRVARRARRSN